MKLNRSILLYLLTAFAFTACREEEPEPPNPEECIPQCDAKACGFDGCGGTCGECQSGTICQAGKCASTTPETACQNRVCGPDGFGNTCGTCANDQTCDEASGQCIAWKVTGNIFYERQTIDVLEINGGIPRFGEVVEEPASDLPIALYDSTGAEKLGEGIVAPDGSFSFNTTRLPMATDKLLVLPIWFHNDDFKLAILVAGSSKPYALWSWSIPLKNFTSPKAPGKLDDVVISIEESSAAIYLYQQFRKAFLDLDNTNYHTPLADMKPLAVLWNPGKTWDCGTCYVDGSEVEINSKDGKYKTDRTMQVDGNPLNESAWGLPTLLHEFGHYILFDNRDDTPGGAHTIGGASTPTLAWSEGFATFYSLLVQSREQNQPVLEYWRLLNNGSYWLDYDRLIGHVKTSSIGSMSLTKPTKDHASGMMQAISEAWVTAFLFNLWDGKDVPTQEDDFEDDVAIGTEGVWKIINSDRYLKEERYNYFSDGSSQNRRHEVGVDLVDFIDAVTCLDLESTQKLYRWIDTQTTFPYDQKPVCTPK